MNSIEIVDYMDRVISALKSDYDTIYKETRALLQDSTMGKYDKAELEWGLTRVYTDFVMLEQHVKQHQQKLMELKNKNAS